MHYQIRHQMAGMLPSFSATEPSEAEVRAAVAQFEGEHPKTGKPYWTKVIRVLDGGVQETAWGLCDGAKVSAAHVDADAAGHCPIREGEIVPKREAMTISAADVGSVSDILGSGTGTVK